MKTLRIQFGDYTKRKSLEHQERDPVSRRDTQGKATGHLFAFASRVAVEQLLPAWP